ncbi:Myelin basic protein [Acipenser ruthenus]|uniref:Myelin basic protein n=1 Tax=Acipenser ruthenus TaxID=7906 RepID=A0A662YTD6_ACIRT|nr:Myelin basic protein [Acipenser ruthenus]
MESDSTTPVVKLSLSAELLPLIKRATAVLQVPWPTEDDARQSIFDDEPAASSVSPVVRFSHPGATRLQLLLFPGLWTHYIGCRMLTALHHQWKLYCCVGTGCNFALLSKDAICPNKQCRDLEVILKCAYSATLFCRMGSHVGKHEAQNEVSEKVESEEPGPSQTSEPELADDNEVFGHVEADVNQNNGTSSEKTAVTDSKGAADTENAWNEANTADHAASRPHLVRLFSRDAPGREDNTFKDRPSESDELQTIQEDSGATSDSSDITENDPEEFPQGH